MLLKNILTTQKKICPWKRSRLKSGKIVFGSKLVVFFKKLAMTWNFLLLKVQAILESFEIFKILLNTYFRTYFSNYTWAYIFIQVLFPEKTACTYWLQCELWSISTFLIWKGVEYSLWKVFQDTSALETCALGPFPALLRKCWHGDEEVYCTGTKWRNLARLEPRCAYFWYCHASNVDSALFVKFQRFMSCTLVESKGLHLFSSKNS